MTWEERAEQILSVLQELNGRPAKGVPSSLVGDHVGYSRRQTYNYLRWLKERGLVETPSPRRWCVV